MSADGKIDTYQRQGTTLSSPEDKARLDRLRAGVDAVMVGGRTLLNEDPKLTVKSEELRAERKRLGQVENPAKVGIATVAKLDPEGDFLTTGPSEKYVFTTSRTSKSQVKKLERCGVKVFVHSGEQVDLEGAMHALSQAGIHRVLVEGGGRLIAECLRLYLVDELSVYIAPLILGGAAAPTLADGPGFLRDRAPRLKLDGLERLDASGGIVIHYTVEPKS